MGVSEYNLICIADCMVDGQLSLIEAMRESHVDTRFYFSVLHDIKDYVTECQYCFENTYAPDVYCHHCIRRYTGWNDDNFMCEWYRRFLVKDLKFE